jgi:uncharacterized protein (UPF0276 family)
MRMGGVAEAAASRPGLPARAGIGLRSPHVAEVLATRPALPWLEVHPENYLGGGPAVRALHAIRQEYPVSFHAVGLSVASADGVDRRHLDRIRRLVARFEPALVSEHLAWSQAGGAYLNHLLPLPYTEESLAAVCRNVDAVQTALGRRVLIENPSGYLRFADSTIPEAEFLGAIARRTGCGLLLDVNNVYVTARNLGLDPRAYVATLPAEAVGEIHLAGHSVKDADGRTLLIDDHGSPVDAAVWALYEHALRRLGALPTLVEWDTDLPPLDVLMGEARRADAKLQGAIRDAHAA